MTSRRHQLTTREGRLRLFRAAGSYLLELDDPDTDNMAGLVVDVSNRLAAVGLHATPTVLRTYVEAVDAVDGLTTGRHDVERFLAWEERHAGSETRDGLIHGFEAVVDYCEGLAVLVA